MTTTVEKIADEVKPLPEKELDEFFSWLAEYELANPDRWGSDIAAGRTKPTETR